MNKPKIYAYCAAGCKWETIHKTDVPARYVYLTKAEYEVLTEYEDDVMYFVYDEGFTVSDAENVCKTIGGLPLENVFANYEAYDEQVHLEDGEVLKARNATTAEKTSFTNNKWKEVLLSRSSGVDVLERGKNYMLQVVDKDSNKIYAYGVVYIPDNFVGEIVTPTMNQHHLCIEITQNEIYYYVTAYLLNGSDTIVGSGNYYLQYKEIN